jgi:CubicO group peptidase (beta-lactamase class C family)
MIRPCILILATAVTLTAGCATRGGMEQTAAIDAIMREYDGAVPGASVMVIRNDLVVFRKAYGLADVEKGIASTPQSNYRLASVTKQFTATAVLLLAERDALAIGDPVRRYLSELPDYADEITIRHLLTHTSGLPDYENLIAEGTTLQLRDRDVLELLAGVQENDFPPGSQYRYSNSGYALLALVIERISGESFASFLRTSIFGPLGMENSVAFEAGISSVPHRAFGHSRSGDRFIRNDQSITSAVLGDGGVYSSIDDLRRWDQALNGATLLRRETLQQAESPAVVTDDPAIHYGFGWRISRHRGHRAVWHSGETRGFRNALVRFPDERLTVIILTNRNESPPYRKALAIADLYLR